MSSQADVIKAALRECRTLEEVEQTASKYRDAVKMLGVDPENKALVCQIVNLKLYQIMKIEKGWIK